MRMNLGVTLPERLVDRLDSLRARRSKDVELAGKDRSTTIEILLKKGLKAHKDGEN